jgi:hypothetical protein
MFADWDGTQINADEHRKKSRANKALLYWEYGILKITFNCVCLFSFSYAVSAGTF